MTLKEAIELIEHDRISNQDSVQTWADLGCGAGLFTQAISYQLQPGSIIYAIDKTKPPQIEGRSGVTINSKGLDFIKDELNVPLLDGIVMANSFHYVQDKAALLRKLERSMKTDSVFIIVEYNTDVPVSHWVPYPLSFESLTKLFDHSGYQLPVQIGQRESSFGRAKLYSALVIRN